jgi:hypothetical protein
VEFCAEIVVFTQFYTYGYSIAAGFWTGRWSPTQPKPYYVTKTSDIVDEVGPKQLVMFCALLVGFPWLPQDPQLYML